MSTRGKGVQWRSPAVVRQVTSQILSEDLFHPGFFLKAHTVVEVVSEKAKDNVNDNGNAINVFPPAHLSPGINGHPEFILIPGTFLRLKAHNSADRRLPVIFALSEKRPQMTAQSY